MVGRKATNRGSAGRLYSVQSNHPSAVSGAQRMHAEMRSGCTSSCVPNAPALKLDQQFRHRMRVTSVTPPSVIDNVAS